MTKLTREASLKYISSRIPSLFHLPGSSISCISPVPAIKAMSRSDWNYFFLGFCGWVVDAFDYFVSSVSATAIATTLNVSVTDITWGMTLVLMFRSLGALIFGVVSDTYGRRPTFLICTAMFVILEIGTGFVQTYAQYLVLRGMFGVMMGAMYSAASNTSLESAPVESRSFLGVFLSGYSLGNVLAIAFYRGFEFTPHSWRALFWFSAAPPFLLFIWRWFTPEHEIFVNMKRVQKQNAIRDGLHKQAESPIRQFIYNSKVAFKNDWLLFVYLVFLLSGMNFSSHGSQDLLPTMLQKQLLFSADKRTVTLIVINLGAIVGGACIGLLSELTGRRLAMIICVIGSSALIYPSFNLKSQGGLMAAGFFMQFFVMGCWGIISIHLIELSPSHSRALFSGLTYQLGNLASSASSTIEAQAGSKFQLPGKAAGVYDYGKVMSYFMAGVNIFLFICFIVGPEKFHQNLHVDSEIDNDSLYEMTHPHNDDEILKNATVLTSSNNDDEEKASTRHRENATIV